MSSLESSGTSSFRPCIETCRDKLYAIAQSSIPARLYSYMGVSDVVQETCLRAYRHLGSFRGKTQQEFVSWMRSILHHQVLNILKRVHLQVAPHAIEQAFPVQQQNRPAFHEETPSHILMDREEQDKMTHALGQLTSDERHILARYHRDAYTFAQLGSELACSEEAARKRWARALLRWKRLVQSTHA